MVEMAWIWPVYVQARICICRRTVSSGKHTEDASSPDAAPRPKVPTELGLLAAHNLLVEPTFDVTHRLDQSPWKVGGPGQCLCAFKKTTIGTTRPDER